MTISVRREEKTPENNSSVADNKSTRATGLNGLINGLSTDLLLGLTSGVIALSFFTDKASSLEVLSVSLWGFLILVYLVFQRNTNRRVAALQRWVGKYGLLPLLTGLITIIYVFDTLMLPAKALFFDNLRTRLEGMFTGTGYAGATGAISAINIGTYALEALMLGYIAYGVVKAIQAGRDDEDWKQPLKLPLLVLFAVAAGDQAITLLSSGGTGTP